MDNEILSIKDALEIIKRKIVLIVVIAFILAAIVEMFQIRSINPQYTISTKLFIGKEDGEYSLSDIQYYSKVVNTYSELLQSEDLAQRVIENNNFDVSYNCISSSLTIKSSEDSQFLDVSITYSDPNKGKKMLKALIEEFIKTSKSYISDVSVRIVDAPKISSVSNTINFPKSLVLSIVIGIMLSLTIVILKEYFSDRIIKPETIEKVCDLKVLGVVPKVNNK